MSDRPLARLRISPLDSAGCNAKLRARDLLTLLSSGGSAIGSLARDSFPTSRSKDILFTIDTILPVTTNPEHFGHIAVLHAINDLHAEGAHAEDVCISYGFDTTTVEDGCAKQIVAGAEAAVRATKGSLSKAHSFLSSDISISVSAIGARKPGRKSCLNDKDYAVVLTKPLGGAMGCFVGEIHEDAALVEASEKLMLQGHHSILELLRDHCIDGTTDVTGFGLVGHLACLAVRESLRIEIDQSSIPILAGLSRISNSSALRNCSAVRNREDFQQHWERENKAQELTDIVMFSGETSGPIACLVEASKEEKMLQDLIAKGFSAATHIATATSADIGRIIIR